LFFSLIGSKFFEFVFNLLYQFSFSFLVACSGELINLSPVFCFKIFFNFMNPLEWFLAYYDYLKPFLPDYYNALTLSDWLIDQGNSTLTVSEIIDYILANLPIEGLTVSVVIVPPDIEAISPVLPVPYDFVYPESVTSFSLFGSPYTFDRYSFPGNYYHTLFYNHFFSYIFPGNSPIDYYLPTVGFGVPASNLLLERITYQSIKQVNQDQSGNSTDLVFPTQNVFLVDGSAFWFEHTLINFSSPCDFCCCGDVPESENSMASCQDLVDAVNLLKDTVVELRDQVEEFKDFFLQDFTDEVKQLPIQLNKVQSHLGQRLPHRDFVTNYGVVIQEIIQKGLGSISQRLGVLGSIVAGEVIPGDGINEAALTDENLDTDTVFDEIESSAGGGGSGGGGGA